eukprot:COSAG06_NODE_7139_length_2616_cov_1.464044_5_plen_65_part_00
MRLCVRADPTALLDGWVQVSSDSPSFVQHFARTPRGGSVVVEMSEAVAATVVLEAAQATQPASG